MYKRSTNDWAHFQIQNQKNVACPQPPRGRKVWRAQMKKLYTIMYKRNTNDWVHFRIQNQKRGDSMSSAPLGDEEK